MQETGSKNRKRNISIEGVMETTKFKEIEQVMSKHVFLACLFSSKKGSFELQLTTDPGVFLKTSFGIIRNCIDEIQVLLYDIG